MLLLCTYKFLIFYAIIIIIIIGITLNFLRLTLNCGKSENLTSFIMFWNLEWKLNNVIWSKSWFRIKSDREFINILSQNQGQRQIVLPHASRSCVVLVLCNNWGGHRKILICYLSTRVSTDLYFKRINSVFFCL